MEFLDSTIFNPLDLAQNASLKRVVIKDFFIDNEIKP